MNKERILQVADAIENRIIPNMGFSMSSWFRETINADHACGTNACIAGWAAAVELGADAINKFFANNRARNVSLTTVNLPTDVYAFLGMTEDEAQPLFYGEGDIDAEQAIRTLRHLAETGEVDWTV